MSDIDVVKKTEIKNCPLCASSDIHSVRRVKDYAVSGEEFTLYSCKNCQFVFTRDIPTPDSMGKYYHSDDYVSHTETKSGLINKLYHKVRKLTLRNKAALVRKYTGKMVGHHLDIGAGTGSFVHAMENSGWNSIGVEPDPAARIKANELYLASIYPMEELENFSEGSYTAITLWHVLEHVHDLHNMLSRVHHMLDEDARLFIAVPNHLSFDARYYGDCWAAYDVPRHLYHFTPATMKKILDQHGFDIIASKPMWFDSFYVSMLSEKYRKGNVVRAFGVALLSNIIALFNRKTCSSLIYIAKKKPRTGY
jgi:2-polyprenyl-3-methyl-5-hydroxy-6-metoxy-1,4-benzoquinol methylase